MGASRSRFVEFNRIELYRFPNRNQGRMVDALTQRGDEGRG